MKTHVELRKIERDELSAKAEMIMMGYTIEVNKQLHVEFVCDYIMDTVRNTNQTENRATGAEIVERATKYATGVEFKAVSMSNLYGMLIISLVMLTDEDEDKEDFQLTSPDGVFGYVYNITEPMFSELGYSLYESALGRTVRIG